MEHNKPLSAGRYKPGHKPLVELVHNLQVHVGGPEHQNLIDWHLVNINMARLPTRSPLIREPDPLSTNRPL